MLREQEIERLRRAQLHNGYPRLRMLVIVAWTGAAGFLASYLLLRHGVESIALRYPLALCMAYSVFLLLLWAWLRTGASVETLDVPGKPNGTEHVDASLETSSLDTFDAISSADEFALPLFAIALAAILICASLWIVYAAPVLFAELLFDGVLAAGLYRRLRRSDIRHWLDTALRRTFLPFALTLLALIAFGLGALHYRPSAHSIGELLHPRAEPTHSL